MYWPEGEGIGHPVRSASLSRKIYTALKAYHPDALLSRRAVT